MLISIIFAAVYGLIFGSFANAVAYRVPTGRLYGVGLIVLSVMRRLHGG